MEKNIKISIGILFVLAVSRFIPHPPNFTSLIALSFYVPALLGLKFLPFVLLSFIFTDIILGFHNTLIFTWGSVFLIGLCSKYFLSTISTRFFGAFVGALIFFIISNFQFAFFTIGNYSCSFCSLLGLFIWDFFIFNFNNNVLFF